MMVNRYIRIVLVLGMVAVMCGTVSAATGIVAETQATSAGAYPVCTAPCECISESTAALRWGAAGYELCSKTICGQSADAMVQYYCIHQKGGTVAASAASTVTGATTTTAPATTTAAVSRGDSAAIPATPVLTAPTVVGITTKSPGGMATVLAAIGTALLVAAGTRRK